MNNIRSVALCAITILLSVAVIDVNVAYACSGQGVPIEAVWERSTHVIKGRIVESDLLSQNHVVQVESYLAGEPGGEHIVVQQQSAATAQGLIDGYFDPTCDGLAFEPPANTFFYMFLNRNEAGVYLQSGTGNAYSQSLYTFSEAMPTNSVSQVVDTNGDGVVDSEQYGLQVSETEFQQIVAEVTDSTPASPNLNVPYPITAPLVTVSANGDLHLIPVDLSGAIPIRASEIAAFYDSLILHDDEYEAECGEASDTVCEIMPEPDFRAFRLYVNGVADDYLSQYGYRLEEGDSILHSSAGTSLIWDRDERELTYHAPLSTLGDNRIVSSSNTFSIPAAPLHGPVWSPNARQFAYADDQGLWLIDVLPSNYSEIYAMQYQRRLVLARNGRIAPIPISFSSLGRYLTVQEGETQFNLDLVTGLRLADGVFSPDEQVLLARSVDADGVSWSIINLASSPNFFRSTYFAASPGDTVVQVTWRDDMNYVVLLCAENDQNACRVHTGERYFRVSLNPVEGQPARALTLSSEGDIAFLTNDNTVSVNGYTIDIETESPIEHVYWLPSLFWGIA